MAGLNVRISLHVVLCLIAGCVCSLSQNAYAYSPTSQICLHAIERAVQRFNVPRNIMLAISLTETGRVSQGKSQPWPWTVNMEGKGHWFETRAEATNYVNKEFARGARSFDVGCFQINYKWHHQHFRSIDDMFDPVINATYAAKYLTELYAEKGDWLSAVGAYHSRTPHYAQRYTARFARYLKRVNGQPVEVFAGNGSEPVLAASQPAASVEITPPWRIALAPAVPPTSSTFNPNGAIVFEGASSGLLRTAKGTLY